MSVHLTGAGFRHRSDAPLSQALRPLDLVIRQGEQLAIIGPSGAGKTTLLHLLATALRPATGEIRVLDRDPWRLSRHRRRALRRDIGLIQQVPPLPARQRVITAVSAGQLGRWSTAKSLLNLLHPVDVHGARHYLSLLDIGDKVFRRCDQLSGGQLQRVALARTLYQCPKLICADEPVSALDPVLAGHTLAVLQQEARRQSATLVVSLHAVDLALRHFDRVIGLRDGAMVFDCAPPGITNAALARLFANQQLAANPDPSESALANMMVPGGAYPCR